MASVRPGTGAEVLKDLTENAVLRVVSDLDPESETDSFDSGMMVPGQGYSRCFPAEGTYTYSTGTGQTGTVVVEKAGATGDVNSDGAVNALDVQTVINEALGISTGCDCDLNGDSATNAIDVQMVINAALGLR